MAESNRLGAVTSNSLYMCAQAYDRVSMVVDTLRQMNSECKLTGRPVEWLHDLLVNGNMDAVHSSADAFIGGLRIKSPTPNFAPTWSSDFNQSLQRRIDKTSHTVKLQAEERGRKPKIVLYYAEHEPDSMNVGLDGTNTLVFADHLGEIARVNMYPG